MPRFRMGDRVAGASRLSGGGQGDVDRLGDRDRGVALGTYRHALVKNFTLRVGAGNVDRLAASARSAFGRVASVWRPEPAGERVTGCSVLAT